MALKRQITKAEHDALIPALQVQYKADGSGETFTLDAVGFDDPAELRRARDREKERADTEKARADASQTKLDALGPDAQRKLADITTLEKSWGDKLAAETGKLTATLTERNRFINKLLVDQVALQMATDLAGENSAILAPHIRTRLQVEHVEGADPLTRVLDKEGKPSASSVADLKTEFQNDPRFKVVVIASRASGGGAAGGNGNGGGAGVPKDKKFGEFTEQERIAFYKNDPEGFKKAADANRAEVLEKAQMPRAQFAGR